VTRSRTNAGIDVHKKMSAVAVADVEIEGDFHFERLKVGTRPVQSRALADWLVEREVEEVVMESTAQYWRPVWEALEQHWRSRRRASRGRSTWPRRNRIVATATAAPKGNRQMRRVLNQAACFHILSDGTGAQ
jgi:hypothetical protein